MTIQHAKNILTEFDRLNLELVDGLNLLNEHGLVSDLCIGLGDVDNEDCDRCIEFLKQQ